MRVVADIGGTKTVLAAVSSREGRIELASRRLFLNDRYSSFESVLAAFLADISSEPVSDLGIAVAGPVEGNRCNMTNLNWVVDGGDLGERFDIRRVILHNDLAASGYGLEVVSGNSLEAIHEGKKGVRGNRALLSPGTGLGESIIHDLDGRCVPIATEGGHADFAPFDGVTGRLWAFLRRTKLRVSVEDVLSGAGLNNVYRFIVSESGGEIDPHVEKEMTAHPGAVVTRRALEDKDPAAVEAIRVFLDVLAAEAGNLALKGLAVGGVYFGGGIIPRLLPSVDKRRFASIFAAKGKHQALLEAVPLFIVTDTDLPLYGAAYHLLIVSSTR